MKAAVMVLAVCLMIGNLFAQSGFYNEYWADFDSTVSNPSDARWRVNDPELSLHPTFGPRWEALPNGAALINVPEYLFDLTSVELYLELWGGHPSTINKKVIVNGKASYDIPGYGAEIGHCTYAYPTFNLAPQHMVNGLNILQFSCERGESFWGHFLMDNIAIRCYLKPDHDKLKEGGLDQFEVLLEAPSEIVDEKAHLKLKLDEKYGSQIDRVEYFAHYTGYDANGDGVDNDWHGFTYKRESKGIVGVAAEYPFVVSWDTEMIPDQSKPMTFRAVIHFKNGMKYLTESTQGSVLNREDESVTLFYCNEMPVPFWSRLNKLNVGKTFIPLDMEKVVKVELQARTWDGGEGDVKEPFKINGHAYTIHSGVAIHDVVFTKAEVKKEHLKNGWNEFHLVSGTDHHGIEMLLPGPGIIIRSKR